MKNKKSLLLLGLALSTLVFLYGCVQTKNGVPTGEGWLYNLLIAPMGNFIKFFAENQGLGFGVAIIVVTLIVRIFIMPLGIYQSWKATQQTEKMQYLKPFLAPIQERMKNATSRDEQLAAQQDLFAAQKHYGVSILGGATGCLPLFIQIPFFTALFYAARYTEGISEASFLGINLGTPSILLTVIAGLLYLGQSLLMQVGVDEEQKKQMRNMVLISPLMIVIFSWSSPAGVTLYWVVGGIVAILQQGFTNFILKPKIRAQIEEEFRNNPPKPYHSTTIKDVTPTKSAIIETKTTKKTNRNAGKQRSR